MPDQNEAGHPAVAEDGGELKTLGHARIGGGMRKEPSGTWKPSGKWRCPRYVARMAVAVMILFWMGTDASARGVDLPVTIDFPLLRTMVLQTAFKDAGQSAVLLDEDNGCRRIVVSDPVFSREKDMIRFESKVSFRMGLSLADGCFLPVRWDGTVVLFQKPVLGDNWILGFETVASEILDENRNSAPVAGIVWDYLKGDVYTWLAQITIDLSPPVSELQSFIRRLFPRPDDLKAWWIIDAMRPGPAEIGDDALRLTIQTTVTEDIPSVREQAEPTPDPAELSRSLILWQSWDAFLMAMVVVFVDEPLSEEDRLQLLDALLETRYGFLLAAAESRLNRDFVRIQFLSAWKTLSPLFRRHLADDTTRSVLDVLAFFSAADALAVLDTFGPSLGIEISRNGLVRLSRLIAAGPPGSLDYLYIVNPAIRRVLGFGEMPEPNSLSGDSGERHIPGLLARVQAVLRQGVLIPSVHAESTSDRLDAGRWLASAREAGPYLQNVRDLLAQASEKALGKSRLPSEYHMLYRNIVKATAWQESCFRQFVNVNGNPEVLVSYNGSSVGLMQINERVWRGIYDGERLRWNVAYNGLAGCEILDLYFTRYALRKWAKRHSGIPPEPEMLARVVYAMYNGGPGQYQKFLRRHEEKHYWLSDRLYFERFNWVVSDEWERAADCLIGR